MILAPEAEAGSSYSLDFVCYNHWVLLADLLRCLCPVVVRTVVFVRVPVQSAELLPTAAAEACEAQLLSAHVAAVLLGLGGGG